MINFTYPLLNREMNDCVHTKVAAINVLERVRVRLVEEIAKIDKQLEELKA